MDAINLNGILNGPTVLELSPFQRWLTSEKQMTTNEAIAVCEGDDHDLYLKLWDEWEHPIPMSILIMHEHPMHVERVEVVR